MAYDITFVFDLFSGVSTEEDRETLQDCLEILVRRDMRYLRANPATPELFRAGIPYVAEPRGQERWQDVPSTMKRGQADCEDVACWRVAELRLRGIPAEPHIVWRTMPDGMVLYHVLVKMPDGTTEDPSRILGMR